MFDLDSYDKEQIKLFKQVINYHFSFAKGHPNLYRKKKCIGLIEDASKKIVLNNDTEKEIVNVN